MTKLVKSKMELSEVPISLFFFSYYSVVDPFFRSCNLNQNFGWSGSVVGIEPTYLSMKFLMH